jgi:outer membrane receptor protein involved in Fe transport
MMDKSLNILHPGKSVYLATLLTLYAAPACLAEDADLVLEEVIVTAQKKSESLSDIAMSVNVVTGETMNEFANFSFQDLDKMTAGVTITGLGFDVDIAARGLGTNMNAPVDPRVALYFDGASIAQERGLFSGLFDLERFELLRGPQGTLYGKASPAGAITMQSNSPNMEQVDGYVQQSFNEHSASNTQFGISIPLIENKLALRLAGLYDTNENNDVENITLGRDNENETWGGRAVLAWRPTDNFNARLSYTRIEDEFDIDLTVDGNGVDFDDRSAVNEWKSDMKNTSEYTILEMDWTLPNDWVLTSVSSNQDNEVDRTWDSDGSEVQSSEQTVSSNVPDSFNTELRLASIDNNDNWDWTTGIYYQDSDSYTSVIANNYLPLGPGVKLLAATTGPADISSEAWAAFAHSAFHFGDAGTLTVGLRYNDIERKARQPFTITVNILEPDGGLGTLLAVREIDGIAEDDQDKSDSAWTGTLKYQHEFTDSLMAYASYDRGWRDGSANVAGRAEPIAFGGFDGEDSDNLELGFKWGLLEGRGQLNMSLYYQIYSDFQFQADGVEFRTPAADGGGTALTNPVVNVDEVESWGLETEFNILLSEYWSLSLSGSYNQTEFTDAKGVPCTNGEPIAAPEFSFNTCDLDGERAGKLPEWSGVAISEFWQPIGNGLVPARPAQS